MSKKDEALKLALEAFEADASNENFLVLKHCVREALAENALDRMAENARELGLDYETAQQQEPFCYHDGRNIVGKEFADHSDVFPLYTTTPRKPLTDKMREMLEVQGQDGNWNYDPYMQGMYNGMEYMLAMVEDREPVFREAPDKWLGDKKRKPLTDEEIEDLYFDKFSMSELKAFARAIEAKLKEKNA